VKEVFNQKSFNYFLNTFKFTLRCQPSDIAAGIVDTSSGKFATGMINHTSGTGGKICHRCRSGGAPSLANISANFRKFLNDPSVIFGGLGEDDSGKTRCH
jgi:hypothetical protein